MDIIQAIRELVETSPDNVYQKQFSDNRCFYTQGSCSDGSTGCIIGQALLKLGVDRDELKKHDLIECPVTGQPFPAIHVVNIFIPDLPYNVLSFCNDIQSTQDRENTWKDAFNFAVGRSTLDIQPIGEPNA